MDRRYRAVVKLLKRLHREGKIPQECKLRPVKGGHIAIIGVQDGKRVATVSCSPKDPDTALKRIEADLRKYAKGGVDI